MTRNKLILEFENKKSFDSIKEKLNSLFGEPDDESFYHFGDYFTPPTLSTYKLSYPKLTITEDDGSVFTYTFTSELSFKLDTNNTVFNQE